MDINPDLIKSIEKLNARKLSFKIVSRTELYENIQKLITFFELLWNLDQNNKNQLNKN